MPMANTVPNNILAWNKRGSETLHSIRLAIILQVALIMVTYGLIVREIKLMDPSYMGRKAQRKVI